jgi:hypothetical protein
MEEKVDAIMERLWNYLQEQSLELIVSVEKEEYERSQEIKEDIEDKIDQVAELLITKGSITIHKEDAIERLNELTRKNMNEWYDILEIPQERRVE